MKITYLGHAGLYIETSGLTILCDPWFNPAYLYSWFPFPENDHIDIDLIRNPDFLYISHLHQDHFDRFFLSSSVNKKTTVLLPDFQTSELKNLLSEIGFHDFLQTKDLETIALSSSVDITINALTSPSDGPLGDSMLIVSDNTHTLLNQNDARPTNLENLAHIGPFDAHFLQFSGAIWYPVVYRLEKDVKRRALINKRSNQLERAYRYIKEINAKYIFPSAGPPCFLDPDLFELNDFGDETSIYCDASVFLKYLETKPSFGQEAFLIYPGSEILLKENSLEIVNPDDQYVQSAYTDKRTYLVKYQSKHIKSISKAKESWGEIKLDMLQELKSWFEPLMKRASNISKGINGRILLSSKDVQVVLDFLNKTVEPYNGQLCKFRYYFQDGVLNYCVKNHITDWVNELFLSLRFEAERDDVYNEYVYAFFKSLDDEKLAYTESFFSKSPPIKELVKANDCLIQRQCPHMKADLLKFGHLEDSIVTCKMHGWQFDIKTGNCLTSDDRKLYITTLDNPDNLPVIGEL